MQKGAEMAMDKQPVTTNGNFKWYAGNNDCKMYLAQQ